MVGKGSAARGTGVARGGAEVLDGTITGVAIGGAITEIAIDVGARDGAATGVAGTPEHAETRTRPAAKTTIGERAGNNNLHRSNHSGRGTADNESRRARPILL